MMLNTEMVEVLKKAIKEHNEQSQPIQLPSLSKVIRSKDFQNRLKAAIEAGVESDWMWDGSEEYRVDTFNPDDAARHVTNLLREYFMSSKLKQNENHNSNLYL